MNLIAEINLMFYRLHMPTDGALEIVLASIRRLPCALFRRRYCTSANNLYIILLFLLFLGSCFWRVGFSGGVGTSLFGQELCGVGAESFEAEVIAEMFDVAVANDVILALANL